MYSRLVRSGSIAFLIVFMISILSSGTGCAEPDVLQASPPAVASPDYLIGAGDILAIEVWKDPALARTVVVLPDGKIVFPLIGDAMAAGRSVASLKKEILERISVYVPDTTLTLEVKEINSLFVYILGRVNSPGRPQLKGNVTVLQALAMVGGLNPFAKRSDIKIIRREKGHARIIHFNYDEVTGGEHLENDIQLVSGDVIIVP